MGLNTVSDDYIVYTCLFSEPYEIWKSP